MIDRLFHGLGRCVVRYRWVIVIVWLVGTVISVKSLPSLASQVNNNNSSFLPSSAPSVHAADLAEPLSGPVDQSLVQVVAVSSAGSLGAQDQGALQDLTNSLRHVPTVDRVQFGGVSKDGKAAQLIVLSTNSVNDIPDDKTLIDRMQGVLDKSTLPSGLELHLAGSVATQVANQAQAQKQGKQTQSLSLLLIIVLLLLIFRCLLAPILTLLPAAVVLVLAQSLIGGLGSVGLKISSITQLLLIVLILGAGTDYGLFLVFRVREEMEGGRSAHEAVEIALARVGESITGSASTVILALLSLSLASFGLYNDLGGPLAIGIAVMLLAGLTLLPALLAIAGKATFWPSRLVHREREGTWGIIAGRLVNRPAVSLSVGLVVFGALAVAVIGYKPGGFGGALNAPPGTSASVGNKAVQEHFPNASSNPTNLIMVLARSVWNDAGPVERADPLLRASGEFTQISGPLDPTGTTLSPTQLFDLHAELGPPAGLAPVEPATLSVRTAIYDAYRATQRYISVSGTTVQWEVGLKAGDPSTTAAINAVPSVRRSFASVTHAVGAVNSGVAGEAPALYDVSTISNNDLKHIVPLAVVVIGIILGLVLRSLVAPLYLLASVVVSYLASLGLSVIVFIYLLGQGGLTFILPFLMFIFLLALGEDYNILVMSRIREEARTLPIHRAVIRAVGATGSTVTSAGLVLAGTFAVFAVVSARQPGGSSIESVGFGLAVGILLDTFVVRTVLVPATVTLIGRLNWWPSTMGRSSGPRESNEDQVAVPSSGRDRT
ncbi:MAG: MMPL family transporter [Acidimicrobiales bacterium]